MSCAEDSLLDISLEEGMDRMDLDELHREQIKRARSINPSISDLRLAVDAAAEMQVRHDAPLLGKYCIAVLLEVHVALLKARCCALAVALLL